MEFTSVSNVQLQLLDLIVPAVAIVNVQRHVRVCRRNSVVAGNTYVYSPPISYHQTYDSTSSPDATQVPYKRSDSYDAPRSLNLHTHSSPNGTSVMTTATATPGRSHIFDSIDNGSGLDAAAAAAAAAGGAAARAANPSAPAAGVPQGVGEGVYAHPLNMQQHDMLVPSQQRRIPTLVSDLSGASSPGVILPCPPKHDEWGGLQSFLPLAAVDSCATDEADATDIDSNGAGGADGATNADEVVHRMPAGTMGCHNGVSSADLFNAIIAASEGRDERGSSGAEGFAHGAGVNRPRGGGDYGNDARTPPDCPSGESSTMEPSGNFLPHHANCATRPAASNSMLSEFSNASSTCISETTAATNSSIDGQCSEPAMRAAPPVPIKRGNVPLLPLRGDKRMDTSELPLAPSLGYGQGSSGTMSWVSGTNGTPSVTTSGVSGGLGDIETSAVEFDVSSPSVHSESSGKFASGGAAPLAVDPLDGARGSFGAAGKGGSRRGGLLEVVQERSAELGYSELATAELVDSELASEEMVRRDSQSNSHVAMSTADLCAMFESIDGSMHPAHAAIVAAGGDVADSVSVQFPEHSENVRESSESPFDRTAEKERHKPTPWMLERNASNKWRKSRRHVFRTTPENDAHQRSTSLPGRSREPNASNSETQARSSIRTRAPVLNVANTSRTDQTIMRASLRSRSMPHHMRGCSEGRNEEEGATGISGRKDFSQGRNSPLGSDHWLNTVIQDAEGSVRGGMVRSSRGQRAERLQNSLLPNATRTCANAASGTAPNFQAVEADPSLSSHQGSAERMHPMPPAISVGHSTQATTASTDKMLSVLQTDQHASPSASAMAGANSQNASTASQLPVHVPHASHVSVDSPSQQPLSPPDHAYVAAYAYTAVRLPVKAPNHALTRSAGAAGGAVRGRGPGDALRGRLRSALGRVTFSTPASQASSVCDSAAVTAPVDTSATAETETSPRVLSLPITAPVAAEPSVPTAKPAGVRAPPEDAAARVFTSVSLADSFTLQPGNENMDDEVVQDSGEDQSRFYYPPSNLAEHLKYKNYDEVPQVENDATPVNAAPVQSTFEHASVASPSYASLFPVNVTTVDRAHNEARLGCTDDFSSSSVEEKEQGAVRIHEMYGALQARKALQKSKAAVIGRGGGSKTHSSMSTKPSSCTTDSRKLSSAGSATLRNPLPVVRPLYFRVVFFSLLIRLR